MTMTEVIINEIDAGIRHTNELLNQIASDKQINEKDKLELSILLNEVVLFTFLRLRQVIIADDAENPNFIIPYSAALIIYGQVYGKVNKIKEKSELMRQCAFKGLAKNQKSNEKLFVKGCWEAWYLDPSKYKNKTKFANDMLDKCEHLESVNVITSWCTKWEKEQKKLSPS